MCGICGFVAPASRYGSTDWQATLDTMVGLQTHRGPDQHGTWLGTSEGFTIGLGHRRLSIIDLSEMGRQPMTNEDGTVRIVFNGEIYNYRELDAMLTERNHFFRSTSDTETIVHLYEEEGPACLYRLNGMFGFGIWDARQHSLFLARDRIGIKPLFYAPLGEGIAFASELKSLLVLPGVSRTVRPEQVDQYLALGYVPGPQTIFEGIYSLPAGYWLTWRSGIVETGRYWYPPVEKNPWSGSLKTLTDSLDSLLNSTVKAHLVADVKVGAFLSGGLDSSLVCAIARRHLKEKLSTFTIGFGGGGDERAFAQTVALHLDTDHHELLVEADLTALLPRFVWHLEQPLFDNSVLPTYMVSQLARKHCKVVLAGDGGDEPFFGYGWTRAAVGIPGLKLAGRPRDWRWSYRRGRWGLLQRGLFDLTHDATERYVRRLTTQASFRHWLYTANFAGQLPGDPQDDLRTLIGMLIVSDWRERYPLADLMQFLPGDILVKVDRMSMAHGLEVRPPLLDHHVVEWVLHLPWQVRYGKGVGKLLLREVARRYLPESILKPRKQGFTIPVGRWLHGPTGELAAALFRSPVMAARGMIDSRNALRLLEMHRSKRYEMGHRLWSLMVFEIWCRVWLDGQSCNQGLESMLKETGDLP